MRALITDSIAVAIDAADVTSLRAEDASGSFGILEGHADFLTTLEISVVSRHHADRRAGYCAIRKGILAVWGGNDISIATREAPVSDDPDQLETVVLAGCRAHAESERTERNASIRLRMQAIRHMVQALGAYTGALDL